MDKIARIRQEIERHRQAIRVLNEHTAPEQMSKTCAIFQYSDSILSELLSSLDTLSEEPDKSLEEEISRTYHDGSVADTEDIDHVAYENIARHFYELGRQSKPEVRFPHEKDIVDKVFGTGNLDGWEYDEAKALVALAKEELLNDIKPKVSKSLEEAAEEYARLDEEGKWKDGGKYKGFIAGAEWQKSQMLKEAVEVTVQSPLLGPPMVCCIANGCSDGDKVRIVVLKAEGK